LGKPSPREGRKREKGSNILLEEKGTITGKHKEWPQRRRKEETFESIGDRTARGSSGVGIEWN